MTGIGLSMTSEIGRAEAGAWQGFISSVKDDIVPARRMAALTGSREHAFSVGALCNKERRSNAGKVLSCRTMAV